MSSQKIVVNTDNYISLTKMAEYRTYDSESLIVNWLTSNYSVQYLGAWEQLHNPNFNLVEFTKIRNEVGTNGFIVSPLMWIKNTNAIGICSGANRNSEVFAHKDIYFEFISWLSPKFKLYLITQFQGLKEAEYKSLSLDWDVKSELEKSILGSLCDP